MVNLHRWLKKNSPHLVVVGSLAITGLSGCRSAQYASVEVEPAPSTYPAPLVVPEAVPIPESDTALTEPKKEEDLFLKPPAPLVADSGSNSSTGNSPKQVLPQIKKPDYVEPKELTESKPVPVQKPNIAPKENVAPKETVGTVADNNDPLDEKNLFPEDNPKAVGKSAGAPRTQVDSKTADLKDAATEKSVKDPFAETFSPTGTNPEVPVPNPGKSTVNVKKPETVSAPKLPELAKPVQKTVPEKAEKPKKNFESVPTADDRTSCHDSKNRGEASATESRQYRF